MTEKPLLRLPTPKQKRYASKKASFGRKTSFPSQDEQSAYFEPKFRILSRTLDDLMKLRDWIHDPASIASERTLAVERPEVAISAIRCIIRPHSRDLEC